MFLVLLLNRNGVYVISLNTMRLIRVTVRIQLFI